MRPVVSIPDRDPGDAELVRRIAASSAQRAMLRATLAREFDHASEEAFGFDGERCDANRRRRAGGIANSRPGDA